MHHSDRGSQYAAGDYRKVLKARGITVSMSRKGDCWDNAPMESANGTLKVECVHGEHFQTRAQAQQAIIEYIGYYNTERQALVAGIRATGAIRAALARRLDNRAQEHRSEQHRVIHRRPVSGSSQATEPAVRG